MKWHNSLKCEPAAGATDAEIRAFLVDVFAPLSDTEINELTEAHKEIVGDGCFDPPFQPSIWKLPKEPLPNSYLDLLRWSNGGYFEGNFRDLDPLFSTTEVRDYMLGYSVSHWMPEACPIGFDGGGGFYLLDMRLPSKKLDYPVLWTHACNLSFDEAKLISESFREFVDTALGPNQN